MCGIAAFTWEDKQLIRKMTAEISHRGPDDSGFYLDKGISLGHRRLSIIDLSKRGHQPMFSEHEDLVVIFVGEIYNFKSIRAILENKGHKFISNSDTEVLLHGYEEYGYSLPSLLEGMFTFIIWDKNKKTAFAARDRFGKKPLYYSITKEGLMLASEIKSILINSEVKREIDRQCLSDYLTLRYSSGNRTMFRDVRKLLPGNYIIWQNKQLKIKEYYSLPPLTEDSIPNANKLDKLIDLAVEERLMADVPVGVFLSGGLDSSILTAFASKHLPKVKTFSIGFNHSTDELDDAKRISDHFGTDHTEVMSNSDILRNLPKVVWHLDEPMADPANLPVYELSRNVSKKVKVALSGEGGDEVFGGYHPTNYFNKLQKIHATPRFIRSHLVKPFLSTSSKLFQYPKKQVLELGAEIVSSPNLIDSYKKMFYFPFNADEKKKLILKQEKNITMESALDRYLNRNGNILKNTYEYYFKEWLPNDLLMKADKMGMAHALEIRTPYLDADLVSYSLGLPLEFKHERFLFRKMAKNILPSYVMKKKKQGFTLPISKWFSTKEFSDRVYPHISDLKNRNILSGAEIDKIVKENKSLRADHKLWVLLNLELWNKIYQDNISPNKIEI